MESFTVRDLRERTGELVRGAEAGKLSLVTKHGKPVFLTVPFDDMLLREGVAVALAVRLFDEEHVSLGRAARIAGCSVSEMTDLLLRNGIPVIRTERAELEREIAEFE